MREYIKNVKGLFLRTQFGFKGGLITQKALFCMQLLVQKCYDQRKDVFICFIDYYRERHSNH